MYLPEWRLLKLPRNLTCSNFVLILYVIRKPLKQPLTTLLGMVVVFCSWSAFFQLSAWIDEKKLWLHWTVSYSFDLHYLYFLFWFSNYNLLTKNLVDIMINSLCIIWYSWLVYPWVTLPISMGHIKLKAFFLGHWSIAISYRCRLDRMFIYNTRTQLKAQKSIMEMLYFFRNILRYATLEIFNLWMNDGNKTTFLRQIKYTSILKWAIQMQ